MLEQQDFFSRGLHSPHRRRRQEGKGWKNRSSCMISKEPFVLFFVAALGNQRHFRLLPTPEMLSLSHFLLSFSLKWFERGILLFWKSHPNLFPNHIHSCFSQLILPRNTYSHAGFAYASLEPSTTDRKQIKLGGKVPFQGNYQSFEMQPIWPVFWSLPAWRPTKVNDVVINVNPAEFSLN